MPKIKDDPVYNQPDTNSTSGSASDTVADDPTYNQPKESSSEDESTSRPARKEDSQRPRNRDGTGEVTEDPTYNQPRPTEHKTESISDDPTYNQPKQSDQTNNTPTIADDPTFNQPKQSSSNNEIASDHPQSNDSRRPRRRDGTGEVTEDPTYNQPKPPENKSQPVADDPTYNQPKSPTSTSSISTTNTDTDSTSRAKSRLTQLTSQLTPPNSEPPEPKSNTKKPRTRKPKSKPKDPQATLPKDYSDITTSISAMQHHAQNPPLSHRGYTRQLQSGKLTARQRIATILNPNTFREVGSVTGTTKWSIDAQNPLVEHVEDFTPSNNPQGFGQVTCLRTGNETMKRQVYLTADDFAIRGGHADGHNGLKTFYGERMALRLKVPVIKLTDGSSGGGSVSTIAKQGWSYVPYVTILGPVVKQLNAGIPNMGAVVGPAIGLGAARVVSTHFSVMAADIGSLFNAGPKVVEGATFEEGLTFSELGGPGVHCCNGTIDNMARDEKECYEQIRTVLGYLPDCGALQAPPCLREGWSGDSVEREDEGLRSVIPRRKNRMYNPYTIIESVVDRGSWFEIGALWGRTGIVGLARLGGRPIAILSNNCEVNGGALDAGGSQKLLKMIKFADVFNLPIVQFVDVREYLLFNFRLPRIDFLTMTQLVMPLGPSLRERES